MKSNSAAGLKDLKSLLLVAIPLFALLSLLLVQFYKIQVVEGEKWKAAADRQHHLVIVEPYERGVFYSNTAVRKTHPEGREPLVIDVPRFHLYADPKAIRPPHRVKIAETVQTIAKLSPKEKARLLYQLEKKSRCRKLALWLTPEIKQEILNWWPLYAKSHKIPLNALFFIQDYKRCYPFGKLLGQILHTVRAERNPKSRECVPTGGLELSLNRYLKGEDGERVIFRSPRQSLDVGKVTKEPQHGCDVYLTINHHLQAIVEEEIQQAVKKAEAKSGWSIIMDPYTGEILAWAEYPFFEPEKYQDYFNDPTKEGSTKVKAISDPFEPGSTIKPITLALCLKANAERKRLGQPVLFSLDDKVATSIGQFPGRKKPLKDLRVHRFLNFEMALQKSSNIYPAEMVYRTIESFGKEWYRENLQKVFGFEVKTGIELAGESVGLLPSPNRMHPNGRVEWSKATPYSIAMGHNILATSLQMVRCYGILANGGWDVKPTLVKKIVNRKGEVVFTPSKPASKRLLEKEIIDPILRGMRYVTKPGGSSQRGHVPGYSVAGKSGTAEKVINGVYSKTRNISSFMGFLPATNPRFVLLVVIDEPACKQIPGVGRNQLGGICAAPAFREIGLKTAQYLGIPPDDPHDNLWQKERESLNALYKQWND